MIRFLPILFLSILMVSCSDEAKVNIETNIFQFANTEQSPQKTEINRLLMKPLEDVKRFVLSHESPSHFVPSIKASCKVFANNKRFFSAKTEILYEYYDLFPKAAIEESAINLRLLPDGKIENLKIEDLSVSPFSGKLSNDFKLNVKGQKKLIITGNVDNLASEPAFKNLRVFIPQQLNITYFDTIAQLKGDIFINGKIKKPDIVGQITAQNVINQFLQLAINNLTVDFNKTVAVLNAPQVKIADSVMGINSISVWKQARSQSCMRYFRSISMMRP